MAQFRCNRCYQVYADDYPTDDNWIKCHVGTIRIISHQGETTMTATKPAIKLFTSQEDETNGIHIKSLILVHTSNNYQFHGGTNDSIYVFAQSIALYVLTIDETNGTMGPQCLYGP
jgi:hypothetical protein